MARTQFGPSDLTACLLCLFYPITLAPTAFRSPFYLEPKRELFAFLWTQIDLHCLKASLRFLLKHDSLCGLRKKHEA